MSYSRTAQSNRPRPGERFASDNRSGSPSSFPRNPRRAPEGLPRGVQAAPSSSRNLSSSTTETRSSSSGGSFLDRIKAPSSRTSLEDDYEDSRRRRERRKVPSRSRVASDSDDEDYDEAQREDAPPPGHGYDIWNRVTTVASQLTINVSQAWQKSVQLVDGEVTPPGEDSRLTKAMKAYHLAKAKSPADLPAWLFEEHERGVSSRTWRASERDEYEDRFLPDSRPQDTVKRGGLRDIYDSVPRTNTTTTTRPSDTTQPGRGSRATDRLREIREAKRTAVQTNVPPREEAQSGQTSSSRRPAPPRGGLPSRPTRRG